MVEGNTAVINIKENKKISELYNKNTHTSKYIKSTETRKPTYNIFEEFNTPRGNVKKVKTAKEITGIIKTISAHNKKALELFEIPIIENDKVKIINHLESIEEIHHIISYEDYKNSGNIYNNITLPENLTGKNMATDVNENSSSADDMIDLDTSFNTSSEDSDLISLYEITLRINENGDMEEEIVYKEGWLEFGRLVEVDNVVLLSESVKDSVEAIYKCQDIKNINVSTDVSIVALSTKENLLVDEKSDINVDKKTVTIKRTPSKIKSSDNVDNKRKKHKIIKKL